MIKLGTLFWLLLVSTTGFAMFAVKYEVQSLEDELNRAKKAALAEQHAIRMDEVEWALLTRPETLEEMNRRHLSLVPIATTQLRTSFADIPLRPPPPAPIEQAVAAAAPVENEPAAAPAPPATTGPSETSMQAPEIAKPIPAKAVVKAALPRHPKTLDDLIAQIVASR